MIRSILCFALLLLTAGPASAHFVFVVPEPQGKGAKVILSEDLKPDDGVDVAVIGGAKLTCRDADGRATPLTLGKAQDAYAVELPGTGSRVVSGVAEFGVPQRKNTKPHLLVYHPKTIVGDAFDPKATLGDATPVEIVPVGAPGRVQFEVRQKGKPVAAGVEVNLILPDGKQSKAVTQADGRTPPLAQVGRFGAWARYFEPVAGERDGKRYEEVRHYATLVADISAGGASAAVVAAPSAYAPLPEATSSFGAVASGGWLYVYGGHIARTHSYSTEAVSGRFHRLNLADGRPWEALPGGPGLQGMNLAAHGGKVYRVGGMEPRNRPGEKADNHSIADCARFDPASGKWEALPPMPQPRSSHDVVVVGDRLIVLGGWDMRGRAGGNHWLDTMAVLDLSAARPEWKTVKQPFERRALIAAVNGGKVYVVGGFDDQSDPSRRVEVYDPEAGTWSSGPQLPGAVQNGFAPAACSLDGRLYVSVGDGTMYRLDAAGAGWEKVAQTTPRIVHRLVPHGSRILVAGGASKEDNLNLIEVVTPGQADALGAR